MYNPYLIIPLATWLICQIAKFAIHAFKGTIDFKYLYASGGMPSVHSAVVSSLATTALLLDGPTSQTFGLASVLAAIVMYDSFGVRRATSEQAKALNMLIDSLGHNKVRLSDPEVKLREVLGHTPLEVVVGAVTGVGLAILINIQKVQAQLDWLMTIPVTYELWAYAGIAVFLIVGSVLVRLWLSMKYKKSQIVAKFNRDLIIKAQTIGWLGLTTTLGAYERIVYVGWRLWPIVLGIALVIWDIKLWIRYHKALPEGLSQEAEIARQRKWLQMPTKRGKRKK